MKCRLCGCEANEEVIDLGIQPLANDLIPINDYLNGVTHVKSYELKLNVCTNCWLVQTTKVIDPETVFGKDYPYFSGNNSYWIDHCNKLANELIKNIGPDYSVLEIGSNDGTGLLPFIVAGIKVRGVDPSNSVAEYANDNGIETDIDFFGKDYAVKSGKTYNVILARNVMAHVPDIHDFTMGLFLSLKDSGFAVIEFPWVKNLVEKNQFDTIYHEHYYYYSLTSMSALLDYYGMEIFECEEIDTHGGSLRIFVQKKGCHRKKTANPNIYYSEEIEAGIQTVEFYKGLKDRAETIKEQAIASFFENKDIPVFGYGAAAKASTFLNYIGANVITVPCVIDSSPHKVEKMIPGIMMPIKDESWVKQYKPKFIYIFAWNWKDNIIERLSYAREWGCKFVTFIPEFRIE